MPSAAMSLTRPRWRRWSAHRVHLRSQMPPCLVGMEACVGAHRGEVTAFREDFTIAAVRDQARRLRGQGVRSAHRSKSNHAVPDATEIDRRYAIECFAVGIRRASGISMPSATRWWREIEGTATPCGSGFTPLSHSLDPVSGGALVWERYYEDCTSYLCHSRA